MSDHYPPGMTSSQIPGFDAVDRVISHSCECGFDGDVEAVVEHGIARGICPNCNTDFETET